MAFKQADRLDITPFLSASRAVVSYWNHVAPRELHGAQVLSATLFLNPCRAVKNFPNNVIPLSFSAAERFKKIITRIG